MTVLTINHRSIEENSSHTIARALTEFCKDATGDAILVEKVEEIAGKGMLGRFRTGDVAGALIVGNEALMQDHTVHIEDSVHNTLESWKSDGKSVALAAVCVTGENRDDKQEFTSWYLTAAFAISDPIRPEAPAIIKALQQRGTDVWMLSGDNITTARAIGVQVGIPSSNIIADVLPAAKAETIRYLQKTLKTRTKSGVEHKQKRAMVAMVGDGINDSPALTAADVGIAIGSGSDIAISSAMFVLVSSNLNSLIILLDLGRVVFGRIKFNFVWALVYNMIALPVAAGAFYPIVSNGSHVKLAPVWASLAMAASSISVVLSSLALRSHIPWLGFKAREAVGGSGSDTDD
jgi:Cu+-exporting ATPase